MFLGSVETLAINSARYALAPVSYFLLSLSFNPFPEFIILVTISPTPSLTAKAMPVHPNDFRPTPLAPENNPGTAFTRTLATAFFLGKFLTEEYALDMNFAAFGAVLYNTPSAGIPYVAIFTTSVSPPEDSSSGAGTLVDIGGLEDVLDLKL